MKYILEALNSQRILQAHLKAAQANAEPKLLKELVKPTRVKKEILKNAPPHDRKTKKMIVTNRPTNHGRQGSTGGNTGLAKVAVSFSADTFVVNRSLVPRINICSENGHLRQARNRYVLF
jgi:hypothetical protein